MVAYYIGNGGVIHINYNGNEWWMNNADLSCFCFLPSYVVVDMKEKLSEMYIVGVCKLK